MIEAPSVGDAVAPRATTWGGWGGARSGAEVASLFHRALALIFLIAWVSLATQVKLLVGSHGLIPLVDFVESARVAGRLSVLTFPSLLALAPGDGPLLGGTFLGIALALVGLAGVCPRLCAAMQTVLYLGYASACRTFLGFQWDNLLLECGLLSTFLPANAEAPIAHLAFRALLFKLYFESGIAKWQSPLFDWRDGSAMTFYFETAPLPTALAWYAHHLPAWWHLCESRATLFIELVLPFAVFGPRRARLIAASVLTLFQILNFATANYGFFCPLSLALHLFCFDDSDVQRIRVRVRGARGARWARGWRTKAAAVTTGPRVADAPPPVTTTRRRLARIAGLIALAAWTFTSLAVASFHFGDPGAAGPLLMPLVEVSQAFRVVNTYHLFAAVTRERIEPEFQIEVDGTWRPLQLRFKPGEPGRAPPFVAPHQPRVDFQLWFYGLAHQHRQPSYVAALLAHLCEDPEAVAALFAPAPAPLPPSSAPLPRAHAARIVFWRYTFTSAAERHLTGDWWSRRWIDSTPPMDCDRR